MAEAKKTTTQAAAPVAAPAPVAPVAAEPAAPAKKTITPGGWEIPIPDGAEFGGLPNGTWISACEEEPKETVSSKGDAQTEFTLTVHDPSRPDLDGRTGKYYCSRKPKAWWNLDQTLTNMDVPHEIINDANGKPVKFHFNPVDCVGAVCKIIVGDSVQPNGTKRSKILQVVSINESSAEVSSSEEGPVDGSSDVPF
jgi:hypothetical protein